MFYHIYEQTIEIIQEQELCQKEIPIYQAELDKVGQKKQAGIQIKNSTKPAKKVEKI